MKPKILFVDDDPSIIQGQKRYLWKFKDNMDMHFAEGGEEALRIMEGKNIDCIVADMRMPGMNGAELLEIVKNKYPQTIRIILSGHSDQEAILKTVNLAHQFFVKPCNLDQLIDSIKRTLSIRDGVEKKQLEDVIPKINDLRSMPDLSVKLMKELNNPDVSVNRVCEILSQDIIMTAEILKIINSAFFGLPHRITNVPHAINLLGIKIIKALAMYTNIFSGFSEEKDIRIYEQIRTHSMDVAKFAKRLAEESGMKKDFSDACFTGGLLHDIGKLPILKSSKLSDEIRGCMEQEDCDFYEAELRVLGINHTDVGAYILSMWGLPHDMIEAARYHHFPTESENKTISPLSFVHIANEIVSCRNLSGVGNLPFIDVKYLSGLKLIFNLQSYIDLYKSEFLEKVDEQQNSTR